MPKRYHFPVAFLLPHPASVLLRELEKMTDIKLDQYKTVVEYNCLKYNILPVYFYLCYLKSLSIRHTIENEAETNKIKIEIGERSQRHTK